MKEALLNAFCMEDWIFFGWTFGAMLVAGLILTGIERSKR